MNLLVTGGTGFFGKALLRYWRQLPEGQLPSSITLISRNPEKFRAENVGLLEGLPVSLVFGDVMKPESLPRGSYTHVLHAATDSTYGPQLAPLERYLQIVRGTENILELTKKVGARRFLLTSSGAVYGTVPPDLTRIPEEFEGQLGYSNLDTVYGVAKRQSEYLTTLYSKVYGFDYVIARCFAFVGEDLPLDVHFAVGNFIRDALGKRSIVINGDGKTLRSYMYQEDLAHWLMVLLDSAPGNETFNVGSDEPVSILDLARLIADVLDFGVDIQVQNANHVGTGGRVYVPDVSRAAKILGLSINISLRDAIKKVIEFHSG